MNEFDPRKPATVHDRLNDRTLKWKPETIAASYREYAITAGDVVEWDGLQLDG